MARVLLLRSAQDSAASADGLTELGHEAVFSPLLRVSAIDAAIPPGGFAAVVLASRNAVRALDQAARERLAACRVFAVGERSAEAARAAGLEQARSAGGDRRDLLQAVAAEIKPPGRLLLLVGRDRHEDLEAGLREQGYEVVLVETYAAEPIETLAEAAREGLHKGDIAAVLHYSPRSARLFLAAARRDLSAEAIALPCHVCLSREVAAALPADYRVAVAAEPTEEDLFQALASALGHKPEAIAVEGVDHAKPAAERPMGAAERLMANGDHSGPAKATGPTLDLKAERLDAPETAAPPAKNKAQGVGERRWLAPLLAAGLAGGVVGSVAVIAPHLQSEGQRPEAIAARLEARLGAMERRFAPLADQVGRAAPGDALSGLAKRFDDLAQSGDQRARDAAAELATRLARLEETARTAPPVNPQVAAAPLAALAERIAKLESTLVSRDPGAARELAETLVDRLAKLETALAAARPGVNPKAVEELADRLGAATARLEALAREAALGKAGAETKFSEIAARLAAVEAALKGQGAAVAASEAVRRRALAEALVGALQRGQPYREALDGLGRLGLPAERAAALAPYADKGAPRAADLVRLFAPLAGRIAASGVAPKSDTVGERISSSFANLVRVRPLDASGANPAAIVARIERALGAGALGEALGAWRLLPAAARTGADEFADALAKRVAAEEAAAELHLDTLRQLVAPKG